MRLINKRMYYLFISSILFMLSGYGLNVWLGRFLQPESYGSYGLVISLVTFINLVQSNGIPHAISKYISANPKESESVLNSGFRLQLVVTILFTLFFYLFAPAIAYLLHDRSLIDYLKTSSLIFIPYSFYALYSGYYNGIHDFKKQSLILSLYAIVKVIFIISLSYYFGILGAIIGFAIAPLSVFFTKIHFPNNKSHFSYKKLIFFSLPIAGFALFSTIQQSIDIYFLKSINQFANNVGYYAAAQNIARIPFSILGTFSLIVFPTIAKNVSLKLHQESRELIHQVLRFTCLLLFPATSLIAGLNYPIIKLLYSNIYLPAATPLSILVTGFAFLTIYTIFAFILNGAGKLRVTLSISLIGIAVNILFCYLFIPTLALNGAALASLIGSLVSMILSGYFVYREFDALMNPKRLFKIILSSLIIYFICITIPASPLLLPIVCLITALIYIFFLFLFKEISTKDLLLLKTYWNQKMNKKN